MRPALLSLLLLAACFGNDVKDIEDFGDDDDGGSDGADGGGGDGADGGGGDGADGSGSYPVDATVEGAMQVGYNGDILGTWTINGVTLDCSSCTFAMGAFFENPDFGSVFERELTWDSSGYVYTNYGEYWGYGGRDGSGYAWWYTEGADPYGYYGYVYY